MQFRSACGRASKWDIWYACLRHAYGHNDVACCAEEWSAVTGSHSHRHRQAWESSVWSPFELVVLVFWDLYPQVVHPHTHTGTYTTTVFSFGSGHSFINPWLCKFETSERKDNQSVPNTILCSPFVQLHHLQKHTQPTSTPTKTWVCSLHPHRFLVRLFFLRLRY